MFARALGARAFELARLRVDALLELQQAGEARLDFPQALGARLVEQAVIGQHAREARRVFLVQQQLERFLPPHDIRRPQLAFERAGLALQFAARVLLAGSQLRELAGVALEAGIELLAGAQRGTDAPLEVAYLLAYGVASALNLVEPGLQRADACAQLLKALFLVGRRAGAGRRAQQAHTQQECAAPRSGSGLRAQGVEHVETTRPPGCAIR